MNTRQALRDEGGWVLMSALVCLGLMLSITLASFSLVDTGQERSRQQRERESSLSVAEGALYSQGFTLAQRWPGHVGAVLNVPVSCTQASAEALCPTPGQITATATTVADAAVFTNVDARSGATWTTKIRDNGGPIEHAYVANLADQAQSGTNIANGRTYTCAAPCRWDANGDKQLWVQARALVRDRQRDLVALLKLEQVLEATPQTAIVAGGIKSGNQGNKIMLYGHGSQIVVRCETNAANCVLAKPTQIQPSPVTVNSPPLMTPSQLSRFKQRAITDGTYFAGCPNGNLAGAVVWVENCSDAQVGNSVVTEPCNPLPPPSPGGGGTGLPSTCVNQYSRPGILIWHCGRMDMSGGWTYRGILYAVNNSDGTCPASSPAVGSGNCDGTNNSPQMAMSMTGGFGVWGAIAIDGRGCLYIGSDGVQVYFDPNIFGAVSSYGTVGLVQNTWRELPPS